MDASIVWQSALGTTILGGVLAATAGLLAQYASFRLDRRRNIENWKRRLRILLANFKHDFDGDGTASDDAPRNDGKEQLDFRYRTAAFIDELGLHLSDAPVEVPEEILATYANLRISMQTLNSEERGNGRFVGHMEYMTEDAEKIEEWAENELP